MDTVAASNADMPGEYSATEEIEPDVWLGERDAIKVLALTEQVLVQRNRFAMILLLAEMDEENDE